MKLKVFFRGFLKQKIGDKCVKNIPPEMKGFKHAAWFGT